jgi:hypothetical membrane protein
MLYEDPSRHSIPLDSPDDHSPLLGPQPLFDFWKDAFSDFGVEKARFPWLYNGGLILSSIFLMLYSIGIYEASSHKLEALSSGLLITASIFLALISLFPGGTEPHNFVSTWFFLQSFFGFSVLGIVISLKGDKGTIDIDSLRSLPNSSSSYRSHFRLAIRSCS